MQVHALCQMYNSLLGTLQDISEGTDHSKAVEARGLHHIVFYCILDHI